MAKAGSDSDVGLAEAIAAVRHELRRAQDTVGGTDIRFTVGPVEMEFAVEVTRQVGAEVSVKVLNVLSVGGKGGISTAEKNRVKVVLNPHTVDGQPIEVAHTQTARPGG